MIIESNLCLSCLVRGSMHPAYRYYNVILFLLSYCFTTVFIRLLKLYCGFNYSYSPGSLTYSSYAALSLHRAPQCARRVAVDGKATSRFPDKSIQKLFTLARVDTSAFQHLGTVSNRARSLDSTDARPESIRLEIRNDRRSEELLLAITGVEVYCVYRYVHFHHVQE
jgi:hypothetical protein